MSKQREDAFEQFWQEGCKVARDRGYVDISDLRAAWQASRAAALEEQNEYDWHDMMSAYNRCPTEMSSPDRMRWMASEFRRLVAERALKEQS